MKSSKIWHHVDQGSIEAIDFCGGSLVAHSQRCPSKESPNEDVAAIVQLSENHGLFAVADGMGGASSGDEAARIVIDTLVKHVQASSPEKSLRSPILDAIESANQLILQWSIGAGATLAVVEFRDGSFRTYHIGDTQVLVCSNHGRIKYTTIAHSPVAMAVEIGVMDENEALRHEDRHLITNFVGSQEMKIEIGPRLSMATRDTLVIGSDGLFDNLTTDELVDLIRAGNIHKQVTQMISVVMGRMTQADECPSKPDDLTFICFRPTR